MHTPSPHLATDRLVFHTALARYGTPLVVALVLLLLVLTALQIARLPLLLTARVLTAAMFRADLALTTTLTTKPPNPGH
jgi:hypothetical protein